MIASNVTRSSHTKSANTKEELVNHDGYSVTDSATAATHAHTVVREPRPAHNGFVHHPLHNWFATTCYLGDVSGTFLSPKYN